MSDSIQRTVNGAKLAGVSSITFDTPSRALIAGEGVIFAGHATEYVVSSPTTTTFTVTPVLSSGIADNEKITRVDPYRLVEFDDILDEYLPDAKDGLNDPRAANLYKIYLRTREYLEQRTEHVFKSRTITEEFSLDYPTQILILKYRPVVSITSITYQYIGETSATTIDSDLYSLNEEQGTVYYPSYWPTGQNHLTVTYVAGFSTIRQDHALNFMQLFGMMLAISPVGKDALLLQSNSKLDTVNRSLTEIDEFIDRNFPQRRVRV